MDMEEKEIMRGNRKNFVTDVLSGYYDAMNMGLDIVDGILKLAAGEDVNNSYIRSISYGG